MLFCFLGNEIWTDGEPNDDIWKDGDGQMNNYDLEALGFPEPSSVNSIKPELKVFGRGRQQITITHGENCASALEARGFLNVKKLVFIVHGFLNDGN